jgi:hypothetical protein
MEKLVGQIKSIVKAYELSSPVLQNNRLCLELCENVHLHYRNLRLEFSPQEYLLFKKIFERVTEHEVLSFKYGPERYEQVARMDLPDSTEFDKRVQLEEQVEGHFHLHFRNLRVEVNTLKELLYDK